MIGKKKEKNQEKQENVVEVNDNILNIISPPGIDFDKMQTSLGENVGRIYIISRYPDRNDYGWLAKLCNLEGTSTTVEFHYTDPDRLISIYDKRIGELKGNEGTLKNESDIARNKKAQEDLKKLVHRLAVEEEPVGYVTIILHVQAGTQKQLEDRIKRVSSKVAVQGCSIRLLKSRQQLGLKAIAPYGIPVEEVSRIGMRNMPISSFLGGFPMANPGLNDPDGYYLGKTTNNRLVILNMWLRGKDRINSNWAIFGPPGMGKSTTLKDLLLLEYAFFGTKIIIFDPEVEYVGVATHPDIKGDVIDCGGGEKGRINPLQARKTAVVRPEELEAGENMEDYLAFDTGTENTESDLARYLQQLKVFFRLYFGKENFSVGISALLEQCLIELYQKFGITWETDVSTVPNDKWPLPKDLRDYVIARRKKDEAGDLSNYRKDNYEKLEDMLFSMAEGADSKLWNGYTTLEAKADFVDLLVSSLLDAAENTKRAQFYNILSWAWTELSKDRSQKVIFAVDEGYTVIDPEYPDIMKYLRNYSKRLRKYEGALWFITHSVVDLLDPAVKRYGQAIIDNACYKFVMGCDGKNLEEAAKIFNLSEQEVNMLQEKNRSQGIFFAGNTRLRLRVDVSDEFLSMMGKAGGR